MKMFNFRHATLFLAVMLAVMVVSKSSFEPSTKLQTFISMMVGEFSNQEQVDQDRALNRPLHNKIYLSYIQFHVDALDSPYTLLGVEKGNDTVNRIHILAVTEDREGNIRLRPFNLTCAGLEKLRFDPSDPPRVINFEPEELMELPKECDPVFVEIVTNVFLGQWPNCRDKYSGEMPHYDLVLSGDKISGFSSAGSLETPSPLPYIMRRLIRYLSLHQMLEGVDKYTDPCIYS